MALERRWYTSREISTYLKMSLKGIYKACSKRRIPFSRVPGIGIRIDKQALDELLTQKAITPEKFGRAIKKSEEGHDGH